MTAKVSAEAQGAPRERGDGSSSPSSSRDETASEETPLLASSGSSSTLRDSATEDDPGRDAEASSEPEPAPPSLGVGRALTIILSFWVLIFLQASNMSGMTMTQSIIAEELDAYEDAMWFTSSYLIATSSLAPVAGRLSTIFSPRALVLPVAFFITLGGLVCSQAHSFAIFIAGRVLMGIGSAGVMTLTIIMVLELTSKRRRGVFVGLVNAGFTIGLSFGAVVFGAALPVVGWRALFWIQSPVSALAGLGAYLSMPHTVGSSQASKEERTLWEKLVRIDYVGAILLTTTIVLFLYGLAGEIQPIPLITSAASLAAFIAFEYLAAADPIIPLPVLSSRGILLSCFAQLGFMSARWTLLYYAPIFVLAVRGLSPAAAGSILIPTNLGFGTGGLLVGWLHIRRNGNFWAACVVSLSLFAVTLYSLSLVGTPTSPSWLFVAVVFLNGLATGASLNYTLAHLLHLSHPQTHYVTTSLLGTFRGFGGSFGTAIGGGVFYRILRASLEDGFADLDGGDGLTDARRDLVKKLVGSPALVFGGSLTDLERHVAVDGYAGASRGTWEAAAALGVIVVLVQAATGWRGPAGQIEDDEDEDEARAALMENEGVGEA